MKITQGDNLEDEFDTDPEDYGSELHSQASRPSNEKASSKENQDKVSTKTNDKEKTSNNDIKANYETKSNKGSLKRSIK